MGKETGISWTDSTWNPIRGCSRVSPGCMNCYAEVMAARFSKPGQAYHGLIWWKSAVSGLYYTDRGAAGGLDGPPKWNGKIMRVASKLQEPLRWRDPRKIFVNSMSDLFHENLEYEAVDLIFAVMALADRHTYQVLTKRAERMKEYFSYNPTGKLCDGTQARVARAAKAIAESRGEDTSSPYWDAFLEQWPLRNVWMGISAENQKCLDERWPHLRDTPAAIRWISAEPLLGPLEFTMPEIGEGPTNGKMLRNPDEWDDWKFHAMPGIDWVVVGGESKQSMDARPCMTDWVRKIKDRCVKAKVPVWVKQLGQCVVYSGSTSGKNDVDGKMEHWPGRWVSEEHKDYRSQCEFKMPDGSYAWHIHLNDSHGADLEEWPEDLRRQEFPVPPAVIIG